MAESFISVSTAAICPAHSLIWSSMRLFMVDRTIGVTHRFNSLDFFHLVLDKLLEAKVVAQAGRGRSVAQVRTEAEEVLGGPKQRVVRQEAGGCRARLCGGTDHQ